MAKHSCNSEITELDNVLLCQENILAFYITVKDLAIVNVLHPEANLSEPVHYLGL